MTLESAQAVLDKPGRINTIYVSNTGGALGGAKYSDEVEERLLTLLEGPGSKSRLTRRRPWKLPIWREAP